MSSNLQLYNNRGLRFTDTFLLLFCEKNSDGTKKLRLKGNELQQRFEERLCPADAVPVGNFLRTHPEVNEIDLSYNDIQDEGLEHLCHMVLRLTNSLIHLNLSNCDISNLGIKTLYYATQEKALKLKSLRLTGNRIGPQGGHLIALSLPFIPSLENLDLGSTNQTVESAETLLQQISRSTLKVLHISTLIPATSLSQLDNGALAESLSDFFRINTHLVELHVQKCQLDAHCIETMLVGLSRNNSLQFLDVNYNNICCMGVELLSEWLKTKPNILALSIAGNNVRNHGGVALSFGLPFSKLRYLDISHNSIGDEGIIAMLYTFKKTYQLRYFLLWGNNFGHQTNQIIQRMMTSKVIKQDGIDVQIYSVDGVLHTARYPIDKYKHRYFGVMDNGCAVELKIKKNRVEKERDRPRALLNFQHIDRYPPVPKLKPHVSTLKSRLAEPKPDDETRPRCQSNTK